MFTSKLVHHNEIPIKILDQVVAIKSIAWPYSYEDQLKWISKNLRPTDIHVLLYEGNILVAYLNLIDIDFLLDGESLQGFGIGNVCSMQKGKGYGSELLKVTNSYLLQEQKTGLLFCKENLIPFYSLNQWLLLKKESLKLSFNNLEIETMAFNLIDTFRMLEYNGISF